MSNHLALFISWLKDNDIDFSFTAVNGSSTLKIYDEMHIFYPKCFANLIENNQMRASRESYGIRFYGGREEMIEILLIERRDTYEALYGHLPN